MARDDCRAFVGLLRAGFLEALAYRGQMVIWVLTSTMPLVMLALFGAVAAEGPLGRYDEPALVAYFLSALIVRQLTSSWVSWSINEEVRDGTLAARLLRPVHPVVCYAADGLARLPLRAAISVPVAAALLATSGARALPRDASTWILFAISVAGGWLISFFVSSAIGGLSLFLESSNKVMDLWLAAFFVGSGYLIPVDLFPSAVREALGWLPFRYQIGLSVEILTGAHPAREALALLVRQWVFVAIAFSAMALVWRRGLARYAAFGG